MDERKKRILITVFMLVMLGILIFFLVQKSKSAEFECTGCEDMNQCKSQCTKYCTKNFLFYVETNAQDNGTITCMCDCKNPLSALKG